MDLVHAAAESPAIPDNGASDASVARKIIESIPEKDKSALLLRLVDGDRHVAAELRSRIRVARQASNERSRPKHRTVAEIRKLSSSVRERRRAERARRKEAERLRKAQEAAQAQRARLDSMKRRGERVWDEVEMWIGYRNPGGYDRALELLIDLRALAGETGTEVAFAKRVESIRQRHGRKGNFIQRLDAHRIGLG